MQVECVWPLACKVGESPVWVPEEQALYFVDIEGRQVHRYHPASGERNSWQMDSRVGAIVPRQAGGFLASAEHVIGELDLEHGRVVPWVTLDEPDTNRLNDAKCDPEGRYFTGTMNEPRDQQNGNLYRLDAERQLSLVDSGYTIANGPAFSPDGAVMYHADTAERVIYAFDRDDHGNFGTKRVFVRFDDDSGSRPDGMTVDSDGYLWATRSRGYRITRFSPGGAVEREVELPVSKVTSCCFGGPKYETLYITSLRAGLSAEQLEKEPLAGGLFQVKPGVFGLPAHRFAG